MRFAFEVTGGVLRGFDDDVPYGAPFSLMCAAIGDEGTVMLKGLRTDQASTFLSEQNRQALARALRHPDGFSTLQFRRRRPGRGPQLVSFDIETGRIILAGQ